MIKRIILLIQFIAPIVGFAQVFTITEDIDSVVFSSTIEFKNKTTSGAYSVWYGCSNTIIDKPFIILEGIDAFNEEDDRDIYRIFNRNDLLIKLRQDGYDIIALDFHQGATWIQLNAMLVVELLEIINDELITNNSPHPIVVSGHSMGGLVARYALAYMQHNSIEHNTRLFVSFDAPQKGANIPLGVQEMVDFWTDPSFFGLGLAGIIVARPIFDLLKDWHIRLLNLEAAKQMSIYYYRANNLDEELADDLTAIGNYPDNLRKIAIANGSANGTGLDFDGGDPFFKFNVNDPFLGLKVKNDVYALPSATSQNKIFYGLLIAKGFAKPSLKGPRIIRGNGKASLDNAPGGFNNPILFQILDLMETLEPLFIGNNLEITNPEFCLIPTISALDLEQLDVQNTNDLFFNVSSINNYPYPHNIAITPFDAIFAQTINTDHLRMNQATTNFLKDEISPENLYIQNHTFTNTKLFEARNTITTGNNVDPVPNRTLTGDVAIESGADVTLRAGQEIILKPGTHIKSSAEFRAFIDPFNCSSTQCMPAGPEDNGFTKEQSYTLDGVEPNQQNSTYQNLINEPKEENVPENFNKEKTPTEIIFETKLYGNYPNPFVNHTNIYYQLGNDTKVTLTLRNMYGQKLICFIDNEQQNSGEYIFTLASENFYPGIYYYTLQSGNYVETRKMVVVK